MADSEDVRSFSQLEHYVHQVLCARENLLVGEFPMTVDRLVRGERFCGLQFALHGPRSVRLGAIWTADRNLIYFYDARGERYLKVQLTHRLQADDELQPQPAA